MRRHYFDADMLLINLENVFCRYLTVPTFTQIVPKGSIKDVGRYNPPLYTPFAQGLVMGGHTLSAVEVKIFPIMALYMLLTDWSSYFRP